MFKFLKTHILASPAGGLRNCNAAAFASFEKYPPRRIDSNSGCAVTEPKPVCRMQSGRDAAYAVTDLISWL